jgi:hypothetical protein
MKIDKIAYEQLFPTGVYANQRYRAEATIEKGDDIQKCYVELQQCVNKVFNEMNPQINWSDRLSDSAGLNNQFPMFHPSTGITSGLNGSQPTALSPPDKIDSFIATINYCTNKKFLENFKKRVDEEKSERLTEAYNNKLKSFQL